MILTYYPPMEKAIRFYMDSTPLYAGEQVLPWSQFRQTASSEKVVILGRHGNLHQYDFFHIQILREKGLLPAPEETTLVLFDWHEDLDNFEDTPLTSASWAYLGLERRLYANLYLVGTDPRGFTEVNFWQYEEELRPPAGEILRKMDRIAIFPAAPGFSFLKLVPGHEGVLADNESVDAYFVVPAGGFVAVRFKGMAEVSYPRRRRSVVVSIDLDVLKASCLPAVCPQGVMEVDQLLAHLERLGQSGPVDAVLICGLTEEPERQDAHALYNLSRILAAARALLLGEQAPEAHHPGE